MTDHYYDKRDLAKFPEIGRNCPDLSAKFFEWYTAVFADGGVSAREKSLIALGVAHAVQCPYASTPTAATRSRRGPISIR